MNSESLVVSFVASLLLVLMAGGLSWMCDPKSAATATRYYLLGGLLGFVTSSLFALFTKGWQ